MLSSLSCGAAGGQDSFGAGIGAFLDICCVEDAGVMVSSQPQVRSLLGWIQL